jgi:hypothetical protein
MELCIEIIVCSTVYVYYPYIVFENYLPIIHDLYSILAIGTEFAFMYVF